MSEEQLKKVIELLSEIVEQGWSLSWQTVEKTEMLLKELKPNEDAIKAIRYLQEVSEALTLTDVSQQRELLIAYHKHNTMIRNKELDKFIENHVDDYLSNL